MSKSSPHKWYAGGLKFQCTQCGNCCSGEPGYVWVNREEIRRIAEFLGHDNGKLPGKLLRRVGLRHSLTEKPGGDCVFLDRKNGKGTCSIYPVRPLQCRTWPFWNSNLKSEPDWTESSVDCPGINEGKYHDFVAIEDVRLKKSWEPGE